MHAGKRIKYIRKRIMPKMSQAQLGWLAFGITKKRKAENTIKYIESRPDIYFSQLTAISKVLKVRYEDLLSENHNKFIEARLQTPYQWEKHIFPKKS